MNKTILVGFSALILAITSFVKADMSISGYQEFFAGSVNQSTATIGSGAVTDHGFDKSGLSNGTYSRITANYSTTLDNGIDVSGTYVVNARDCSGNRDNNCNVVNFNSVAFSSTFGTIAIGEKFDAGAAMLSRMTASGPMSEPDSGNMGHFYTAASADTFNFGSGNEQNYADNAMKITYNSNVYSGFSLAVGYTPNMNDQGVSTARDAQALSVQNQKVTQFSDVFSTYAKYEAEMDGVKLQLVYGMQTGNAGELAAVNYADLEETAYSARIDYGNFAADYRKNEAGDSGQIKNNNAGNDEGTSICAQYMMGNIGIGACQVETNFTDVNNLDNNSTMRSYSAEYQLGGGAKIGLTYFDADQTANNVTMTDADGIVSRLAIGF
ncbi:porin [Pelagibacteraceae bacterium]|nr:porin [Pelagibacteraceae bacterium]